MTPQEKFFLDGFFSHGILSAEEFLNHRFSRYTDGRAAAFLAFREFLPDLIDLFVHHYIRIVRSL